MAKIVIIKNNFFAAGKNDLQQEIIDLGPAVGILPGPFGNASQLPLRWRGDEVPEHGTMAIVYGTGGFFGAHSSNGTYYYLDTLTDQNGDEHPIDEWVSDTVFLRNPFVLSTTLGAPVALDPLAGETVADAEAPGRDWVFSAFPGGGTSDAVDGVDGGGFGYIEVTASGVVNDEAKMKLDGIVWPPQLAAPRQSPCYFIMRAMQGAAQSDNALSSEGSLIRINDSLNEYGITLDANGTRQSAFYDIGSNALTGAGILDTNTSLTPEIRLDLQNAYGSQPAAQTPGSTSGRQTMIGFNAGYAPGFSDVSLTFPQGNSPNAPESSLELTAKNGTIGNVSTIRIYKIIGLGLSI